MEMEIQISFCKFYHAIVLFGSMMNPVEMTITWPRKSTWPRSYFLGECVRYMRTMQSYRHSSKNLTWSIFPKFRLSDLNSRTATAEMECLRRTKEPLLKSYPLQRTKYSINTKSWVFPSANSHTRNKSVGIEKHQSQKFEWNDLLMTN